MSDDLFDIAIKQEKGILSKPSVNGWDAPAELAPETTTSTFKLYTIAELMEFPEPTWLVDPFIVDNGITELFGKTGGYKTFLAVDWAARTDGLAVYISAEGSPRRFAERVAAWEHAAGHQAGIMVHPNAVDVISQRHVIAQALAALHEPVRLLVIDTVGRNMAGNENATEDMSAFVAAVDKLRAEFGCAILVVHHTGHDNTERGRGSSALPAAADVIVKSDRKDALEVKLTCEKMRDGTEFDPLIVRMVDIDGQLVAAQPLTRSDALDEKVRNYLQVHPNATANEVFGEVGGTRGDVLDAVRRIRAEVVQVVRNAPYHPDQGGTEGGGSIGEPPPYHDPTLDPDEVVRAREDGGW